jgi:Holliday junction resolvase
MKIAKSSRHAKLTGDFAEHLVLYWLSKYGFECARVDHTGIDLIARNPKNGVRMGISVKSRSRTEGKEKDNVRVEVEQLRKAAAASQTFGCTPYMAIVVDGGNLLRCFVLPLKTFYALYPSSKTRDIGWAMNEKALARYYEHPEVKIFEFMSDTKRWW